MKNDIALAIGMAVAWIAWAVLTVATLGPLLAFSWPSH